jgi:hypothetical protein
VLVLIKNRECFYGGLVGDHFARVARGGEVLPDQLSAVSYQPDE